MKTFIAAVVAGVVIFVWGFVSWTVLPWHNTDVHKFSDENLVMQTLANNAPKSGVYYIPGDEADYAVGKPAAFVNVLKNGYYSGMSGMMIKSIIANILLAFLVICLLSRTTGLSFLQKVGFVSLTGLIIGIAANFPAWNWFGFPTYYSLVMLADVICTWFLAGLVIAKLAPDT